MKNFFHVKNLKEFVGIKMMLKILREPLTGKELYLKTNIEVLKLWKLCKLSDEIEIKSVATHYLRLERKIPQYARFSPSIQREFITYSVIGLKGDEKIDKKSKELKNKIIEISSNKFKIAEKFVSSFSNEACFIIAGDVALNMAHSEPREEKSTGELVNGSDLDIVAITLDNFDISRLDKEMHIKKYVYLKTYKEEVDYIVKPLSKVEKQAKFESFEDMVACKILNEGKFLYGNVEIFKEVKKILKKNKIPKKIKNLEKKAKKFREKAEKILLSKDKISKKEYDLYFSTTQEFSEIF
ncbi:MAG: hypothetical protein DRN25_00110 [Thermoplasmata archaeon]|nr:MAG: hypothetical protein DRN25_00110 [Thermoplasmata archaeon]